MRYILDSASMKQCDANTMDHYGMLSAVLMERAAMSVVDEIMTERPDRRTTILIACGTGNNGGDGIAMARLFYLKGYPVTILFPGDEKKCSLEAMRQLNIAHNYGIPVITSLEETDASYDVIADALFGIGLDREIGGIYAPLIEKLNRMDAWKVAVDISSGISADHGSVMGIAFRADLTVTFGFAKIGQMLYPGADYTGRLMVKDIGIDEKSLLYTEPAVRMMEKDDLQLLPKRTDHTNKGSYGKILVFAGSHNMAGAAVFSGKAAYRSGAGLVKIATDESNREIIQTLVPEAVLSTYDSDTGMDSYVKSQIGWADAVIVGPGLGQSQQAEALVHAVIRACEVPCVIDADALNILSGHRDWFAEKKAEWILTPHPGEMSRLMKKEVDSIQKELIPVASSCSNRYDVITVLKDARTVIAAPDGKIYINTTGNHGMATAGSGDVLTGIIGALLGAGARPEMAASLGVLIHGMAGDAAAAHTGKTAMTASDMIEGLCSVFD